MSRSSREIYEVKLLSREGEVVRVRGEAARQELEREDAHLYASRTQRLEEIARHSVENCKPRPSVLQRLIDEGKADPISDRERELAQVLVERQTMRREKRHKAQREKEVEMEKRISKILRKNQV